MKYKTKHPGSLRLFLLRSAFVLVILSWLSQSAYSQEGPGHSLVFNSPGSRLSIKALKLLPPWTVELWVRRQDSPGLSAPLFIDSSSALKLEQFNAAHRVGFTKIGETDYAFDYATPTNQWVHLAIVSANGESCLYTNGNFHSCITGSISLPLENFGYSDVAVSDQLKAEIDELRVWQSERSGADIKGSLYRRLNGDEEGLFAYWHCDDNFSDYTANAVKPSTVGNASFTRVTRSLSSVPFAPDLAAIQLIPDQTDPPSLRSSVNPGNLPTTLRFLVGDSLSTLTNHSPAFVTPATNASVAVSDQLRLPQLGGMVLGQLMASNAVGITVSPMIRAWSPTLSPPPPQTNECHDSHFALGGTARVRPVAISAAISRRVALKASGEVVGWGQSWSGMLVPETAITNAVSVACSTTLSLALLADGKIAAWGSDAEDQLKIPADATPAIAISAGRFHNMALTRQGRVVAWGPNTFDDVLLNLHSVPSSLGRAKAIAAGNLHNLVLTVQGTVVAWGINDDGQCNVSSDATNVVAIAAGFYHSLALRSDGRVVGWGKFPVPDSATNVIAIAAGRVHSLALRADGSILAWGDPSADGGQLTVPTNALGAIGIAAGADMCFAFMPDGTSVSWGYNEVGSDPDALIQQIPMAVVTDIPSTPGKYNLIYQTTNAFGTFSATQTLSVVDSRPPVVTLNGGSPFYWILNVPFVDPGITVSDACDDAPIRFVSGKVDSTLPGTYPLEYVVTDASGNSNRATRLVIIPPTPFLAGDLNGDGTIDSKDVGSLLSKIHGTGILTSDDLNEVLAHYYTNSQWIGLTNLSGLGGSKVVFTLQNGPSALNFQVEYSTNLTHWTPLGNAIPRYEFIDTNAISPTMPRGTYRLRWP